MSKPTFSSMMDPLVEDYAPLIQAHAQAPFFLGNLGPRPPVYGPPAPAVSTPVVSLELHEHGIYASGSGWEAEAGYLTDDEARALRDFLNNWSPP